MAAQWKVPQAPKWRELIGVGVYTVPEAARLTGVSSRRIHRWLSGSPSRSAELRHSKSPLWQHDLPAVEGVLALSFRDLIEVRFVDAFLKEGVRWKALRVAAEYAGEILATTHPFSTRKFKTDGRTIFTKIAGEAHDPILLDLVRNQYAFSFLEPYLHGLEYRDHEVRRWFPLAASRRVVIDPGIAFGRPVVLPEGVRTSVLAQAVDAEGSLAVVAKWYEVDERSVKAAVAYERTLAAA